METLAKDIINSFNEGKSVGIFKVIVRTKMLEWGHLEKEHVHELRKSWRFVTDEVERYRMRQRTNSFCERSRSYSISELHKRFYQKLERIYKLAADNEVMLAHLMKHLDDPLLSINAQHYLGKFEQARTYEEVNSIISEHNTYLESYLSNPF